QDALSLPALDSRLDHRLLQLDRVVHTEGRNGTRPEARLPDGGVAGTPRVPWPRHAERACYHGRRPDPLRPQAFRGSQFVRGEPDGGRRRPEQSAAALLDATATLHEDVVKLRSDHQRVIRAPGEIEKSRLFITGMGDRANLDARNPPKILDRRVVHRAA